MNKSYTKSFYILTSLFFMWGFITVLVDSLIPRIKELFELSYFEAGLVQFAFFIAYGIMSIPSGKLLHRIGYKKGIITGLTVMGIGCVLFSPAAAMRSFELFLLSYFILASGMTILQVAANPYVTVLGDPKTASSRLNLSQAFNSLGTTLAPILGAVFILSDNIKSTEEIMSLDEMAKAQYYASEASAVQGPFYTLAIALLILAFFVLGAKLPPLLRSNTDSNYSQALKHNKLKLGALGIFLYVGAEVAIGSYLVNYFLDMNLAEVIRENKVMSSIAGFIHQGDLTNIDSKGLVGSFVAFYWGGAMLGRFIGAYLTRVYSPNKVLGLFALLAITCIIISMSTDGLISLWSILAVGLFNSIMFPTIFSISIEDLDQLKPEGSGILCTVIAGGAFIPPLYGYFTDISGFKTAFLLLIACYTYIWFFAKKSQNI